MKRTLLRTFLFFIVVVCAWFAVQYCRLNTPSEETVQIFLSDAAGEKKPFVIPPYSGDPSIELDGNIPGFTREEILRIRGENYSPLDSLGRCGEAEALLDRDMRPAGHREEITEIRPAGWRQKKYPGIIDAEPPYLYNRCHLIAYSMTGQNANERNLITGTRYLNTELMLPYEIKVLEYMDRTDNHVLYRVTPAYSGDELVARGVEMEAWSVEDEGRGVCFHVFLYNIQPGIEIDYSTGESREQQKTSAAA